LGLQLKKYDIRYRLNFQDYLKFSPDNTIAPGIKGSANMVEDQAQTKLRTDTGERREPVGCLGEPGIANRKASSAVPWESDHPINIRLSIPLLFKTYYVTIIAGEERRTPERLSAERRKHPLVTRGNLFFFALVGTVIGLAGLALIQFATMYLLDQSGALVP
jgi:hypothetical protein